MAFIKYHWWRLTLTIFSLTLGMVELLWLGWYYAGSFMLASFAFDLFLLWQAEKSRAKWRTYTYSGFGGVIKSSGSSLTVSLNGQVIYSTEPPHEIVHQDRTQPIYGWRSFPDIAQGYLVGNFGALWYGRDFQATCNGYRDRALAHLLDPESCMCGIYGLGTLVDLLQQRPTAFIAKCQAYGTVASDGDHEPFSWRASDVQLEELYIYLPYFSQVSNRLLAEGCAYDLSAKYSVPVKIISDWNDLIMEDNERVARLQLPLRGD